MNKRFTKKFKMKSVLGMILIFACVLSMMGCGNSNSTGSNASAKTRTITDFEGRNVEVPENVESIVCTGVGALRYSTYMGAADLVVGVEDYETKAGMSRLYNYVNFDKFKSLPVIGKNGEPNAEEIIKVNPQVIVMSKSASVKADDLQKKTGIPVVVVPGSDTTLDEHCFTTIKLLGELFNKKDKADDLTKYLQGIKDDFENRTKDVKDEDKLSVYVGGVSYKGQHGFEGTEAYYGPFELIHAKNLANTTDQKGAFNIDTEKVLEWDPDVIFLDFEGMDLINEDYAKKPDFYNNLKAVKEGKVYSQISFRSSAANLDTALANAYYAGIILYPEQFKDVNIDKKVEEIYTKLLGTNPYDKQKETGREFKQLKLGAK